LVLSVTPRQRANRSLSGAKRTTIFGGPIFFCFWHPIVRQALADFKDLLMKLAGEPANNFVLVDTQGTLAPADCANELHPYPQGFKAAENPWSMGRSP
jgi:hypothetical protein